MVHRSLEIIVRPEAEEDIREAYQYYEECSVGLGADFLISVDAILSRIHRHPGLFQKIHKNLRRGLLERFPYGVFYLAEKDRLVVIAVLDCRRNRKHGESECDSSYTGCWGASGLLSYRFKFFSKNAS